MNLRHGLLFAVLFCPMTQALQAQGILLIERENTSTHRIQIDRDRMRVETRADGAPVVFIFDARKQTVRIVDIGNKSYTEVARSDMDELRSQLDAAMLQIQEQLKDLPAEQRRTMEQLL